MRFDVIHSNIRGQKEVTGMDGNSYTEKEFAIKYETNFTPSLVFFNKDGEMVLRQRGYRPPYQFRAALEYVADAHYLQEPFSDYMARAEEAFSFGKDTLNAHEAFLPPPYALDRSHFPAERPLLVAFERRNCHSCDVLHAGPLSDPRISQLLRQLDASERAELRASYDRKKAAGMDSERIALELTGEIRSIYARSSRTKRARRAKLRDALRDGNGGAWKVKHKGGKRKRLDGQRERGERDRRRPERRGPRDEAGDETEPEDTPK